MKALIVSVLLISPTAVLGQAIPYKDGANMELTSEDKEAIRSRIEALYGASRPFAYDVSAKSATGETASGVVLLRRQDSITLDITPCRARSTLVTIIAPYRESSVSDEICNNKTFPRVQVVKGPRSLK